MDRQAAYLAVRSTIALMNKVAKKTSTQSDDLMVSILYANQDRLIDAVMSLADSGNDYPSDEVIRQALDTVGIKV